MANIMEAHLHRQAQAHHATMKKLDAIRERRETFSSRAIGTVETVAGAWLGGTIEGKTTGGAIGPVPINLGLGGVLLAVGHLNLAGKWSGHLNNFANGFLASYLSASGYNFGKNWRDSGKVLGGQSWGSPYQVESPLPPPQAVHGDMSQASMAAAVQQMQQAAAAQAQP